MMSAAVVHKTESRDPGEQSADVLTVASEAVEVRRRAAVAAGVGLTAAAVAIAYLARAVQNGSVLDWALAVSMGLLGVFWLAGFVDARTPLLVADVQGVRIRLGRTWRGLPWTAVHHVEYLPRRGLLRDGRLVIVPHNLDLLESGATGTSRRVASVARVLRGAPLAVPLSLSTRVVGGGENLSTALGRVARNTDQIVVLQRTSRPEPTDRPTPAVDDTSRSSSDAAERQIDASTPTPTPTPTPSSTPTPRPVPTPSPTPSALRESTSARRSETRRDVEEQHEPQASGRELRQPGRVSLVEETQSWGDRVRAIARPGEAVEPLVLDDFEVEPAEDPVVGPELAAARTRLGLSVDQLAERTRIRPHVIEAVEVDDFEPCGGDFYARGHVRTLARVLGVDVTPLLASYDQRYAHAPVDPRRVFEAELATGASGSIRSTRGGPNWSVLVAVVMALVLCWSIAQLVMDAPPELRGSAPVLNGSGGPEGAGSAPLASAVPVVISAPTGGAQIVVRDGGGDIVFKGNLAAGQSRELKVAPPVRVQSTDGAVTVALEGAAARPVGETGVAGQGTFVSD